MQGFARLVRAPALHFLAIGGLLFAVDADWQAGREDHAVAAVPEAIVITASQVEQLRQDLIAQNGIPPNAEQIQAAIEAAVDEEILYRQALALGLDQENAAVRQRLFQIARFVAEDPNQDEETLYRMALRLGLDRSDLVMRRHLAAKMRLIAADVPLPGEVPPSEDELAAWLQRHPERFMEPWRVRLTHVYLSGDRGGYAAETDAQYLLGELRATGLAPEYAPKLGDSFLLGHHLPWQSRRGLRRYFGPAFVEAVAELEPAVWSEPIRSSYGWHLVWVHALKPAAVPPLAAVRDKVRAAVLDERREWRLRQTLTKMRVLYSTQVDWTGGASLGAAHADG
jgi:peptidyl-prolyl cis-trans isomerase C